VIDVYALRARLAPAAVVLAPAGAFVAATAFVDVPVAVVSGVVGIGVLLWLTEVARDAGRRSEPALWEAWGGPPTTRRLRYRNNETARIRRLHEQIERLLRLPMPSEHDEARDPAEADAAYARAISATRARTRDKNQFPLVFSGNADYGFRRNLFGLRRWGIDVALVTLGASVGIAVAGSFVAAAVPAAVSVLALALYEVVVTPQWIHVAADAYADRLIGALDELSEEASGTY
jgi:hypothetical protein